MTPEKQARAEAISTLIRLGWTPPTPSDQITQRILDDMERAHHMSTNELTQLERDTLALFAEGLTATEAAEHLHVSAETVRARAKVVQAKLGARNMTNAVHLAGRDGLLEAA